MPVFFELPLDNTILEEEGERVAVYAVLLQPDRQVATALFAAHLTCGCEQPRCGLEFVRIPEYFGSRDDPSYEASAQADADAEAQLRSAAICEGRACPECFADILGNDPHEPDCGIERAWRQECADAIWEEPDQEG